jgi:DNA mismatch endonuclease, patch repair protein
MTTRRTDILSLRARSELMGRIRGKHTKPELFVRKVLSGLGYRYRIHVKSLPGCPDIVFARKHAVIFVHGCFWHRHHCGLAYVPQTRRAFWQKKFRGNVSRDRKQLGLLKDAGWKTLVVWECELRGVELAARLRRFLGSQPR